MPYKFNPFTGSLDETGAPGTVSAAGAGTAAVPSISFVSDPNTGIYSPDEDQLAVATNGVERVEFGTSEVVFNDGGENYDFRVEGDTNANLLFVDASTDRVGVGTSGPRRLLEVSGSDGLLCINATDTSTGTSQLLFGDNDDDNIGRIYYDHANNNMAFWTNTAEAARIRSDGMFEVKGAGVAGSSPAFSVSGSAPANSAIIDTSGRLLVGTSTSIAILGVDSAIQVVGTGVDSFSSILRFSATAADCGGLIIGRSKSATEGTNTPVVQNDALGEITFAGATGTTYHGAASISAFVDGEVGTSGDTTDMPGRLVFSTTADGSASPTPRMTIKQNGVIDIYGPGSGAAPGYTTENLLSVLSSSNNGASKYHPNDGAQLYLSNGNYSAGGVIDSSQVCKIILNTSAGAYNNGAIIHVEGTGAYNSGQLVFSTGWNSSNLGTERFRIDASGRCLVGIIASPAHALQVSTDSAGKPSTNTWTIVSDERIKEEIELADLDLCYQAVKTIPLKRFKWKDEVYTEEQVRDRRKLGWIAQDVEAVFPKAVGTYEFKYNQVFEETIIPAVEEVLDDEGNVTTPAQPERIEKGELISEDVIEDCRDLNSDQLYAAMYGAIQKLMLKVETLEAEVALLKAA